MVTQLAHDPQPEFRPLGLLEPQAQNLLAPRAAQANRQIYRAIADQPFVADLHPQRVEEHHRIGRLQAPILPGRDFLQYRVGYRTHQVG